MSAIFDIDGTLISKGVRPNDKVVQLINRTPDAYIITGRQESERDETVALLHKFGIQYDGLLMNNLGPEKKDQIASKKTTRYGACCEGPYYPSG